MGLSSYRIAAIGAAIVAAAAPLKAQVLPDVIGQTIANANQRAEGRGQERCLRAPPAPAAERLAAARAAADLSMRTYLDLAGAAAEADVSPAYQRWTQRHPTNLASWLRDGQGAPINQVDDPLARAITAGTARIDPAGSFVLAVDGASAVGVWPVLSPDGATRLGHYRVIFKRESRAFPIDVLALVRGAGAPAIPGPYCRYPGDVDLYREDQERYRRLEHIKD